MKKADSGLTVERMPGAEEKFSFGDLTGTDTEHSLGDRVIYDLTDVIEEGASKAITVAEFDAEIMKKVTEITEKIAREMVPDIAERILREEIEKLKNG